MSLFRNNFSWLAVFAAVMIFGFGCSSSGDSGSASAEGSAQASGDRVNSRRAKDSPMHMAAELNDDETIKRLLGEGVNANIALKNGTTPLHIAARNGQMRAATALLAGGANAAALDDNGETPLMMACLRGYEGMIK